MPIDTLEREELSNKTEIEKLLDEIKNSAIGFENYKQFFDKVRNSDQVIMTQIENLVREYREYKVRFTDGYNKDSHKQLVDDGFVQVDVFEDSRMMNKILLEAYNWKTLQEELYSIIFKKIYTVLDDARALDIKRDALKEMREMEEKRNAMALEQTQSMMNMVKDVVSYKLQSYDEKFLNLVMMIDEDNRRDRKDIFDTLKRVVQDVNVLEIKKRDIIVKEIQKDEPVSKRERLYKEPEVQQPPVQQPIPEPLVERAAPTAPLVKPNIKMDDIDNQFEKMDDEIDDGEERNYEAFE